jgi:hypothetical protein
MDTCSTVKQPVAVSRTQLVRTSRKANAAYLMSTEQGMLSLKRSEYALHIRTVATTQKRVSSHNYNSINTVK